MIDAKTVNNRAKPQQATGLQAEPFEDFGPINIEHSAQVHINLHNPYVRHGIVPSNDGKTMTVRVFGELTPNQREGLIYRVMPDAKAAV